MIPFGLKPRRIVVGLMLALSAADLIVAPWSLGLAEGQNLESEDSRSAKNLEDQISGIKSQIENRRRELAGVLKKQSEIQDQLRDIDVKQDRVARGQEKLRSDLLNLEKEKLVRENELKRAEERLSDLRDEFRERLVANYKMLNQASGVSYLASAQSATDLLRRSAYLSRISQKDHAGVRVVADQVQVVQKARVLLDGLTQRRQEQLQNINKYAVELQKSEKDKRDLFERRQAEARGHELELKKLERKELELEALLESLTGGDEPKLQPTPVPTPQGQAQEIPTPLQEVSQPPEPPVLPPPILDKPKPFNGKGLEPLRGELLFPVSGRLIHAFGMQRHSEFSEVLFHKGVEMEVPESSSVQVIASGKIVVEQELPGIGLTLIVDHGDRYYSLYGRLRQSLKHRGQEVQRGEAIGKIGPSQAQGKNFYFELRFKGKAINPDSFFKNLPKV